MQFREQRSKAEQIRDISYSIDGDDCILRWLWPAGVESVYIYKVREDEEFSPDKADRESSKLYTRAEYKQFNGYCERIQNVDKYMYIIYPYVRENDTMALIEQNGADNRIVVCTGRILIKYAVRERKKLFSNRKTVQIVVETDVRLKKDMLCYVKQVGREPRNNEDGTLFHFISDFEPGRSVLSDIEISKDEYIRIFFLNAKNYGEIYDLYRME